MNLPKHHALFPNQGPVDVLVKFEDHDGTCRSGK